MVSYGPWIQGPDFDATLTYLPNHEYHVAPGVETISYATETTSRPGGYDFWTPEQIEGFADYVSKLQPNLDSLTYASTVRWGYYPSPGLSAYNSWREGWTDFGFRVVWMFEPGDPPAPGVPPGAIAREFMGENTLLTVSLSADTELRGAAFDESDPSHLPEFTTRLYKWTSDGSIAFDEFNRLESIFPLPHVFDVAPPLAEIASTPAVGGGSATTLGVDIDLMPLVGDDGRLVLYTVTAEMDPRGDMSVTTGDTEYAAGYVLWSTIINRTYRPRPYRWVFESEPPETYRRTFPPDHPAAGVPRTFPPSKSQSGNRTSGHL